MSVLNFVRCRYCRGEINLGTESESAAGAGIGVGSGAAVTEDGSSIQYKRSRTGTVQKCVDNSQFYSKVKKNSEI